MQCSSPLHCLLRKNEPLSSDSHSPHICLYGTVSCALWWHSMLMPLSQLQCIVFNSSFVYRQKVVLGNIAVAAQSCIAWGSNVLCLCRRCVRWRFKFLLHFCPTPPTPQCSTIPFKHTNCAFITSQLFLTYFLLVQWCSRASGGGGGGGVRCWWPGRGWDEDTTWYWDDGDIWCHTLYHVKQSQVRWGKWMLLDTLSFSAGTRDTWRSRQHVYQLLSK